MNYKSLMLFVSLGVSPLLSQADDVQLQHEIQQLQQQTIALQTQLNHVQQQLGKKTQIKKHQTKKKSSKAESEGLHNSPVSVKSINGHPESVEYNPVALMADGHVVSYIAGMPVVSSPYLGDRPAFDGSDYIVNISSINRDVRLMQQRRRLYRAYEHMGYPRPNLPIIQLSGKAEPVGSWHQSPTGESTGDWTLGSSELDVAGAINDKVEAYLALAYDESPPALGGARVANSGFNLNMGFVNIGDLDESPYYFTAGQLYVPFGRFSSAMISSPLTMRVARTKTRPVIFGYKSQRDVGPFAAAYAYKSDTTLGNSAVGGFNLGYIFNLGCTSGELGGSIISSMDDAGGMQFTGSSRASTFAGFSSSTNGSELVHKVAAGGLHAILNYESYSLTAEWVSSIGRFRAEDLSFNGHGAQPQAAQLELGKTFMAFDKPSSIGVGYQWSHEVLALNLPEQRINGVFNISIWKDTVESIEYRHDFNYGTAQFGNGAAPAGEVNANTIGPGGSSDTVLAQIGVYF